jgi:hypothetical protein
LHGIFDAFNIIYLQYWLQEDVKESFPKYHVVLKHPICKCPHVFPKEENVVPILVLEIIYSLTLDLLKSFFKIPMKNQTLNAMKIPLDFNLVTWL